MYMYSNTLMILIVCVNIIFDRQLAFYIMQSPLHVYGFGYNRTFNIVGNF